jgi:hypothetical protein
MSDEKIERPVQPGQIREHKSAGYVLIVRHFNDRECICETARGRRVLFDCMMSAGSLPVQSLLEHLNLEKSKHG